MWAARARVARRWASGNGKCCAGGRTVKRGRGDGCVALMVGTGSLAREVVVVVVVLSRAVAGAGAIWGRAVRLCRIRCQQNEDKASPKHRRVAVTGAARIDRQRTSMRQCVRRAQRVQGLRWCQERGRSMVVVSKVICVGEAA